MTILTSTADNIRILDKHILKGCESGNGYIFRDAQKKGRWCLYFINKETFARHRIVLKEVDGRYPSQSIDGLADAERLGLQKFFEMKSKTDRGEKIKTLSIKRMYEMFIAEEKKRISDIPHSGITPARWRLLKSQGIHYLEYITNKEWGLGRSTNSAIHLMPIEHLEGYFTYRRKTTNQTDKKGRPLPRKQTIKSELFNAHRMYEVIGVRKRYINKNQLPIIPKDQLRISLQESQDVRQSMFDVHEYVALERAARDWYIKGISRFHPKTGELFGFEKYKRDGIDVKKGDLNYKKPIRRSVIFGQGKSPRALAQIAHRKMIYYAMRITMDTGLRIGTLAQLRWSNIQKIPKRSKRDERLWKKISVLPEQGKKGVAYEIPAPIGEYVTELKTISSFTKPDNFIFANQKDGSKWSERIWHEGLVDMCIEANLADRNKEAINKAMIVRSGQDISWYSFRHSFITFRLNAGHPIQEIAAHCNTSIEYIQKNYYHADLMDSKAIDNLELGRYSNTFKKGEPYYVTE